MDNNLLGFFLLILVVSFGLWLWGGIGFITILNRCNEDPLLLKKIERNADKLNSYQFFYFAFCLPLSILGVSAIVSGLNAK